MLRTSTGVTLLLLLSVAQTGRAEQTAEALVYEALQGGQIAKLGDRRHPDRVLSAEFVQGLVTGAIPVHRRGVRIDGCVVEDALDLSSQELSVPVELTGCRFVRAVRFDYARASGPITFDRSRFDEGASFEGLRAGAPLRLNNVQLHAGVTLAGAQLFALAISGTDPPFELILSDTHVQTGLTLKNATVTRLWAPGLRVGGALLWQGLSLSGPVNLEFSALQSFVVQTTTWPKDPGALRLHRMQYDYWLVGKSWREQLNLAEAAVHSGQVYRALEAMYLDQGHQAFAHEVFLAWKAREAAGLWRVGGIDSRARGVLTWTLLALVGHGRRPWLAAVWALPFLLVGLLLLRDPKGMRAVHTDTVEYRPGWYVLDAFLPLIDLRAARHWTPAPGRVLARTYTRVLTLVGWVLVPLGVCALTGALG